MRRVVRALLVAAILPATAILSESSARADAPVCKEPKTTCTGHSGYYASTDDLNRLTAVADPILRDVRTCLDGSGAKHVPAALVIRWNSDGQAVDVKIDVPGYESLPCVQKAKTKLSALQNPHETAIQCEFGCPKQPPLPAPAPAPAPTVAPAPTTSPTTSTAPSAVVTPTPAPPPAPPPQRYENVWYGYQTLIPDAISIPAFFGGVLSKTGALTGVGYLGFILITPVVHMVHGNIGKGFGSMGIRLAAPPTAALIGLLAALIIEQPHNNVGKTVEAGALVGAGAGAIVCAAVDAFGFAYDKHLVDEPQTTGQTKTPTFSLAPSFGVNKDAASVGVVGQF